MKFGVISFLVIIAISFVAFPYLETIFKVYTGYNARRLCTNTFISNRSFESAKLDLHNIGIEPNYNIDFNSKSVSSSFFGISSKAVFINSDFGCTLVHSEYDEEFIKKFQMKPRQSKINTDEEWPKGEPEKDSQINDEELSKLGFNAPLFKEALNSMFFENKSLPYKSNSYGVAVIYQGKLIAEKYGPGFSHKTPLLGWSMTKSVVNALFGIRTLQGKVNVKDNMALKHWDSSPNDDRSKIPIESFLSMSSGLEFAEVNGIIGSHSVIMLFTKNSSSNFAASFYPIATPDSVFSYSSGTSNMLSQKLRETFEEDIDYWSFPRNFLFDKIGMNSAIIEVDAHGTFVGSSYCYATVRDWARFGLLYLQDGVWNGERILPEGWVQYTKTPSKASPFRYGAHWWINLEPDELRKGEKHFPDLPSDAFFALGFENQFIVVVPSKEAIIVRLGMTRESDKYGRHELSSMVSNLLKSFPSLKK